MAEAPILRGNPWKIYGGNPASTPVESIHNYVAIVLGFWIACSAIPKDERFKGCCFLPNMIRLLAIQRLPRNGTIKGKWSHSS